MSRGERLSILGLYNSDNSLFSEMVFPEGFTVDEKQTVVQNILVECAELELLFPDRDFMKSMIPLWSKINVGVWQRIFTASKLTYNPIENYNRTETETITDSRTDAHSGIDVLHTGSSNTAQSSTTINQNGTGTDTQINKQTAYENIQEYVHDSSLINTSNNNNETSTGSGTETLERTDTTTHGEQIAHNGTNTRENHTAGNIGVMTSQQMLEQEIEVSAKLNVMQMIVDSFKNRFCLLVY